MSISRSSGLDLFGPLDGLRGLTRRGAPPRITLRIDRVRPGGRGLRGAPPGAPGGRRPAVLVARTMQLSTSVPRPTPAKKEVATWATTPRRSASKLRAIRQLQVWSLHGVEQKSGGRWKAVVVGSYERGDRAVTVQKLAELADFYGVPVAELLPEGRVPSGSEPATKIVINLERLQQLPADKVGPLARYAAAIQSQRGDYNGKVLSIRAEDLRSLAIIYDKTPGELTDQLIDWGVLPPEARPVG